MLDDPRRAGTLAGGLASKRAGLRTRAPVGTLEASDGPTDPLPTPPRRGFSAAIPGLSAMTLRQLALTGELAPLPRAEQRVLALTLARRFLAGAYPGWSEGVYCSPQRRGMLLAEARERHAELAGGEGVGLGFWLAAVADLLTTRGGR